MHGRVSILAGIALVAGGVVAACGVTPATPTPTTAELTAPPSRAAPSPVQAGPERWTTATWTPVEEPLLKVKGTILLGVDTDGSRIVAWGETTVPDGTTPSGSRTIRALWTSTDGLTWRRHEVKRPTGQPFRVAFATVAPSGYLVAGSSRIAEPLEVMTSVDAERWTVVGAWPDGAFELVRSTGGAFVTLGLRDGLQFVFVSSDGSAWEATPVVSEPGRYGLSDSVPAGGGLLLAGTVEPGSDGSLLGWNPDGPVVDLLRGNPMFVGPDGLSRRTGLRPVRGVGGSDRGQWPDRGGCVRRDRGGLGFLRRGHVARGHGSAPPNGHRLPGRGLLGRKSFGSSVRHPGPGRANATAPRDRWAPVAVGLAFEGGAGACGESGEWAIATCGKGGEAKSAGAQCPRLSLEDAPGGGYWHGV